MISREKVLKAINECFGHSMTYKGTIQVFPESIYHVDGKKVLKLYKDLEKE